MVSAGSRPAEAWPLGEAQDALLQAERGGQPADLALCQWQAAQHPSSFSQAGADVLCLCISQLPRYLHPVMPVTRYPVMSYEVFNGLDRAAKAISHRQSKQALVLSNTSVSSDTVGSA